MSTVTVQSRINSELKEEAAILFAAMGMSTADAIRIFLQQTVNAGGLPFQPTTKTPNKQTLEALLDIEEKKTHKTSLAELQRDMEL